MRSGPVRLLCVRWYHSQCRVAPAWLGRVDACDAHAEGAVRAPGAGSGPAKARGQLPSWGARSRPRSARQRLAADRSRGT